MLSIATVSMILTLLQEAPSLYQAVVDDISAVQGGGMTAAQFDAKWAQMNSLWAAAKAKWAAAGQPTV